MFKTQVKMCEDLQGAGSSATVLRFVFFISNHSCLPFASLFHFVDISLPHLVLDRFYVFYQSKASFCPASLVVGNKNYSELIGEKED